MLFNINALNMSCGKLNGRIVEKGKSHSFWNRSKRKVRGSSIMFQDWINKQSKEGFLFLLFCLTLGLLW